MVAGWGGIPFCSNPARLLGFISPRCWPARAPKGKFPEPNRRGEPGQREATAPIRHFRCGECWEHGPHRPDKRAEIAQIRRREASAQAFNQAPRKSVDEPCAVLRTCIALLEKLNQLSPDLPIRQHHFAVHGADNAGTRRLENLDYAFEHRVHVRRASRTRRGSRLHGLLQRRREFRGRALTAFLLGVRVVPCLERLLIVPTRIVQNFAPDKPSAV